MGSAVVYRVTTRISRLNTPGGDVWGWTRRMVLEAEALAIATSPFRSGELKRSHGHAVTPLGDRGVTGTVNNYAPHAVWVHEGTGLYGPHGTPIVSPWGDRMVFIGRDGGIVSTRSVAGQQGNPWMREALDMVLRAHGGVG